MQKVVASSKFHQSYECNCQICFQQFDAEDKRPYIICENQHISCMKCLNQYLQKQKEERLSCLFCRQDIFQDKLTQLRPLLSLIQKVKKQKQQNEVLVDKFNNCNQWKKSEVNEIVEAMTTIFIYKIQECDKNNTRRVEEIKEQINKKTTNYSVQSQQFFNQIGIWMRNMQIKNQQILEETRKVISQSKKQEQENKQLIAKLLKGNKEIVRNQDEEKGKTDKIITQIQNLKTQTHEIIKVNAKFNEKFNEQKRNSIIQKYSDEQKQKIVKKKASLENISMKIANKPKQKINEQPENNKSSKTEQNHLKIRSKTAAILNGVIREVEKQQVDQLRDFKKQKKMNSLAKEEVKQKNNNPQINIHSLKLIKKQLDAYLPNKVVCENEQQQQQSSINSGNKLSLQIKDISKQIPRYRPMILIDPMISLQDRKKVERKRKLQLNFLDDSEQDGMQYQKQCLVFPMSAKNFNGANKMDENSSSRRSFGHKYLFSARNYSYNNQKAPKIDIFEEAQKKRKSQFIQRMSEIYGKKNKLQYLKFYQQYPLTNNEELIILWGKKNDNNSKKKTNKATK